MESLNKKGLGEYLEENFNLNNYSKELIENIIDYGIRNKNTNSDQLAYFLAEVLPSISYEELLMFFPDQLLSDASRIEKYEYLLDGVYARKLNPDEVFSAAKTLMDAKDIDHHGLGKGMDDLYLRKNEISTKIYDRLSNKTMVTTFIDQIDHDTWYEFPFCYPVVSD